MASELRIRPEWLSKILNGHQPPSYNVGLRFEDFLRRRGLEADAFARTDETPAPAAGGAEPEALRKRIEEEYLSLLASAGDDVEQLETIAERLPLLRLPRRVRGDQSHAGEPTAANRRARRAPRKATNGGPVSIESLPRTDRASPMVPREIDRRDVIAERYRALALEKGSGA